MKEDWIECTVENIGRVLTGGTPSKKRPEFYSKNDYPFYKPTDLNAGINVNKSNDYLSSLGFENSRKAIKNSILVTCIGATIGKTGLIKNEGAFNQQINALFPKKGISNIFLYYQIIGSEFQQQIKANASSTTLPILNKSKFLKLKLNIPPLVEQKAIVKKIEELFSSLDSGIADLKKAQNQLVIYRQAVLKKAFEGELTKEWREKNKVKFDWENTTTGEVMPDISSGSTPKAEFLSKEGEIQFLKVYNLNFDGTLNENKDPAFTTKEIHNTRNKRAITKAGDVLINIVGPPLGKTSMIPLNCKKEFNINQAIVRFRPNKKILPKYLSFFLQNPETINWLEGTSKATAGQYNVKVTTCRIIPISLPQVSEQHQIVQEIESRLSVCDKVEKDLTDSLEKAQALRQSILKKAFEGKLLSEEEIAACKQHPDYEPASVLLERIKAEKKKL